jgi:hypothetical protein
MASRARSGGGGAGSGTADRRQSARAERRAFGRVSERAPF